MKVWQIVPFVVVGLLTSCGSSVNTPDIRGQWVIARDRSGSIVAPDETPYIMFGDSGEFSGNNSVNLFFGQYKLDGGRLTFSNIGVTQRLGQSVDTEVSINEALDETRGVAGDGDTLILIDRMGREVLTLVRQGEVSIVGDWYIVEVRGMGTSSAPDSTTITFGEDSRLVANTGTNLLHGRYSVRGDTVEVGDLTSTRMAAGGNRELEQGVIETLGVSPLIIRVNGGEVELVDGAGSVVMRLRR